MDESSHRPPEGSGTRHRPALVNVLLRSFFSKHNCQDVERRIGEIRKAATHDQAVIRSAMFMVQAAVRQIQTIQQDISQCEERIEQLTKSHPDFAIFDSLPGAADALIPRLIAALGTQREWFSSAAEIQSYSGIAPVVKQSGNNENDALPSGVPAISAANIS